MACEWESSFLRELRQTNPIRHSELGLTLLKALDTFVDLGHRVSVRRDRTPVPVQVRVLAAAGRVIHERHEAEKRVAQDLLEELRRPRVRDLAAVVELVVDARCPIGVRA